MTIATAWKTPLGYICLIGQEEWLERIVVGHEEFAEVVRTVREYDAELLDQPPNSLWKECKRQLTAYAAGKDADFSQFPLNLSYLGPFQAKVVAVCRRVPRGKVLSYQQLAAKAGSPRAYRAAGTTMSSNRFPIVIPCHRIVATSGLGGYSGPTGPDFKRKLLELEEVDVDSLKKPVKKGKPVTGK